MRKGILIIKLILLTSVIAKSQTDTICNLVIRASSDSIFYKEISAIDTIDSNGFKHKIITEKAIIYLQIDSIIKGEYFDKNIVVESEPIIRHMVTEDIQRGEIKTKILTGSGVCANSSDVDQ